MTEREYLLTAATSLLLIALLRHIPAAHRRVGPWGCRLFAVGALLPLLDPLVAFFAAEDRIALLAWRPLFSTPFYGLALIAFLTVLSRFVLPRPKALRIGLALVGGFALYLLLATLTPAGAPLLEPWLPQRVSLPLMPAGHPLLLGLLVLGLVAVEALRRWRRWTVRIVLALVALYFVGGALAAGIVRWRAAPLAHAGGEMHVYPDSLWFTRWLAVWEGPQTYEFERYTLAGEPAPEPTALARWNEQPMLIKLLSDPVVRRFYYEVFRHPVARVEISGGRVSLLMQEVQDLSPPVPGRTFYLESDLRGSNRFYQLQRFD